jgi:hypothetical protein
MSNRLIVLNTQYSRGYESHFSLKTEGVSHNSHLFSYRYAIIFPEKQDYRLQYVFSDWQFYLPPGKQKR